MSDTVLVICRSSSLSSLEDCLDNTERLSAVLSTSLHASKETDKAIFSERNE
jgi:hypothetical protein